MRAQQQVRGRKAPTLPGLRDPWPNQSQAFTCGEEKGEGVLFSLSLSAPSMSLSVCWFLCMFVCVCVSVRVCVSFFFSLSLFLCSCGTVLSIVESGND